MNLQIHEDFAISSLWSLKRIAHSGYRRWLRYGDGYEGKGEISIAMVAVMLLRIYSGKVPAVDSCGNGNHQIQSQGENMVENKAYGGHALRKMVGITMLALLLAGVAGAGNENNFPDGIPLQNAIKKAIADGNFSVDNIEGIPEYSIEILEKNDGHIKLKANTRITFKNPKGAGYTDNIWPKFEIAKTNSDIKAGNYDQQIKESILSEIKNINSISERSKILEEYRKYNFENGPRTYEFSEKLEITYPEESTGKFSTISPFVGSSSINTEYDILMGFTKNVNWNYSREENLTILGILTAWVKGDAEINATIGLRLPTTVGLSTPESMIVGQSYTLNTNINGQDWDAAKYSAANVPSENGNEFVAGGQASLKVQAWALAIGNIGPYYLNKSFDYGESFKTPFGPYEEFPIAEQTLSPDQTHIKIIDPPSQLWAGIGLKIDPDLGSDKITANWSTGGDVIGNGTTEYNMPYSNYYFGPVTANDYSTITDYATIKLSDFKYHFTICRLSLGANLHVGFSSFINLQTPYFDLYDYNCDWATGGYNIGIHQGTTANNMNKNIFVNRLTVVSPKGGEKWERGTTHAIRWKYTGSPGTNVTIELLKNGALNRTITPSTSVGTSGSGSYNWLINSTQTLGSDYRIRITSTMNLAYNDTSDSNFTISPISSITVVSPNNGENWTRGTTKTINWTSTGNSGAYVKIELLKGGVWKNTIISITPNDGSHSWLIPATQAPGNDYKVRITSTSNVAYTDTSDKPFTIPTPTITVVSPNGTESWIRGTTQTIKWNSSGSPGAYVKIELLKSGIFNRTIISITPNDGSHPWPILATQAPGKDYKVRITSTTNASYNDTSDNNFTIPVPSFTIVYPDGSKFWIRGTTQTIKWNSTENPRSYVRIEILKSGVSKVIILSTLNDGSHPWLIPANQIPGNDYNIRVSSAINLSNNDTSDNSFTIPAPSFTVVSPNGSENWTRGITQTIRWNSTENPKSYVKIELLKPGVTNKVIILSTLNDGSHPWLVPANQILGNDYKIRVSSTANISNNDTSDNNFSIIPPKITVTSPGGGQTWTRGTTHLITWNYTGNPGTYVKIELLKGGMLNRTILASTPNDRSQSWTILSAQAPGTDYKIRVTSTTNAAYNDTSDSNFNISSIIP